MNDLEILFLFLNISDDDEIEEDNLWETIDKGSDDSCHMPGVKHGHIDPNEPLNLEWLNRSDDSWYVPEVKLGPIELGRGSTTAKQIPPSTIYESIIVTL